MICRSTIIRLAMVSSMLGVTYFGQTASNSGQSSPMITGTVTYRAQMALPPAIDVRLEDVSRADAPAVILAEKIFATDGKQVPIPFQLPYSASDIQPSHRYQVRAQITVEDKLLFATTNAYPVITGGAPSTVNMILQPVNRTPPTSGGEGDSGEASSLPLLGTDWSLTELDGYPPATAMGKNIADLTLDGAQNRYSGSSGCNRLNGGFELDGHSLHFKAGASTMMACPEPLMTQEQAFTKMLQSVTGYRISGRTLELLAGDKTVAKFKAAKPAQAQQ